MDISDKKSFLVPLSVFLSIAFIVPLLLVAYTSVYDSGYTSRGYLALSQSKLYRQALVNTLLISGISGVVATVLGYIVAYHLSLLTQRRRALYIVLVMLPFWTSILVKSFAFTVILGHSGIINNALRFIFGEGAVTPLIFNRVGVIIGLVHWLLPFAVLPILNNLLGQDDAIKQAATLMGASATRIFCKITLPLSVPGIVAGLAMCSVIAAGSIVTPSLLGGRGDMMLANLVDFYVREALDWTVASSISMTLLFIVGTVMAIFTIANKTGIKQRQLDRGQA